MLRVIGRLTACSCTISSQRQQDFLTRAISITLSCTAIRFEQFADAYPDHPQITAAIRAIATAVEFPALTRCTFQYPWATARFAIFQGISNRSTGFIRLCHGDLQIIQRQPELLSLFRPLAEGSLLELGGLNKIYHATPQAKVFRSISLLAL